MLRLKTRSDKRKKSHLCKYDHQPSNKKRPEAGHTKWQHKAELHSVGMESITTCQTITKIAKTSREKYNCLTTDIDRTPCREVCHPTVLVTPPNRHCHFILWCHQTLRLSIVTSANNTTQRIVYTQEGVCVCVCADTSLGLLLVRPATRMGLSC